MATNQNKQIFIVIAIIYFVYGLFFIFQSSYIIDGIRYYCLFDDAMISMQYAKNFVSYGFPQWDINSEAVQGYTNPLWMWIMALVHLVESDLSKTSLYIQIFALIIMLINLFFVYKITNKLSNNSKPALLISLIVTAFYLPLNFWALFGMETSLLVLLFTMAVYFFLSSIVEGRQISFWIPILCILSILTRLDALLGFIVIYGFLLYSKPDKIKVLLIASISIGFAVLVHLLYSKMLYGEWLPNTYALKMQGFPIELRIQAGLFHYAKFLYFLNPLVIFILIWVTIQNKQMVFWLILASFVLVSVYSIYVGGDAWEWWGGSNRFIATVMPLVYILLGFGLAKLLKLIFENSTFFNSRILMQKITLSVVIISLLVSLNSFNYYGSFFDSIFYNEIYVVKDNRNHTRLALTARELLAGDQKAAIVTAGALGYFIERSTIDILGKNDRQIANLKVADSDRLSYRDFYPGHNKWDYNYSIANLKPDAVLQLWKDSSNAIPILNEYYKLKHINGFDIWILDNHTSEAN